MAKVLFKRRTTAEIEELPVEDGSLIYNTDNGKTYMDFGDDRIQTGGNADTMIAIGGEEPTDEDIKIWFPDNVVNTRANEIDLYYPVGTYYETSNADFNPNIKWGGTWEKEEDGTVLSSKSTVSGSLLNAEIGTVVGEDKHTLTVDEMPKHNHDLKWDFEGATGSGHGTLMKPGSEDTNYLYQTADKGGNQPHNNIQRTKICIRWHRIA